MLLFAAGGFLLGGAWAMRQKSILLALALLACAGLAIASGILRYQ